MIKLVNQLSSTPRVKAILRGPKGILLECFYGQKGPKECLEKVTKGLKWCTETEHFQTLEVN